MSSRSRHSGRSFSSFSSRSMGSYFIPKASYGPTQAAPIKAVTVNQNLLVPVKVDIDPTVRAVRYQEKEQIKSLNNRFASFIDKVRNLEQQNKMLETKWKLLQQETTTPSQVKPMLEAYIANLQRQLDLITKDKSRLDMENSTVYKNLNDYRTKYEQEINKRNDAEKEFVMLKKKVDACYVSKVELEDLVSGLSEEIMFLTAIYDAELRELQENLRGTSVVVQMDNSRGLNMEKIVSEVKDQYEEIAARSREEAENWHRTKFEQMKAEATRYGEGFCNPKYEISKLKQKINRLQIEIETSKSQLLPLETQIAEAEQLGDTTVKDAKACIVDLEKNLQRAKVQMAQQIRDYQELMNVKLALDIEISTYKKLLEGEERRHEQNSISNKTFLNVKAAAATKDISGYYQQRRQNAVFIKTVETNHTYRANM